MPGWNEELPVFYIHWHSSTDSALPCSGGVSKDFIFNYCFNALQNPYDIYRLDEIPVTLSV